MSKKKKIPVFDTHQEAKSGFFIKPMGPSLSDIPHDVVSPHRDELYLLFVLKAGFCRTLIDFKEVVLIGPAFGLIHPEQVHALLDYGSPEGWVIAFEPALLAPEIIQLTTQLTVASLPDSQAGALALIDELSTFLWRLFRNEDSLVHPPLTLQYLLNALVAAIARLYQSDQQHQDRSEKRADQIASLFRQLLKSHFISWKRPSQYAQAMHLSVNHLNDTVREKTGYSVSYWIQHHTMLEARRLLYHTQQTVKEVAHQLGFDDPRYFSRLFRKVTGQSPLFFRQSFRDLSTESL